MVYLLHFDTKLSHAQHYIGWAKNTKCLTARINHHRSGTSGARIMEVIRERGITFQLVRTWGDADRTFERRLKNRNNSWRECPICKEARSGGA